VKTRKFHKHLCSTFTHFSTRPTPDARRAVLFPQNEITPRFVWLSTEEEDFGYDEPATITVAQFDGLLVNGITELRNEGDRHLTAMPGESDRLPLYLRLMFRDDFHYDGSPLNRCIANLAQGATSNYFRGPFIVYGLKKENTGGDCMDIDTRFLTPAVDLLMKQHPDIARRTGHGTTVQEAQQL